MESSGERQAFSHKAIYIGFGVTLALGFLAGLYIFFSFTTYEPKALRRIPEDARFVTRLNVQQAVVHQPLVRSVLPVFERGREGPESRLLHLERRTTLELDVDVRELVYAELSSGRWLVVAGGFLRSDEVLEGIGRMLEDEKVAHELQDGVMSWGSGVSLCVAQDGSLVLAQAGVDARRACGPATSEPEWAGPLSRPGVALGVHAAGSAEAASQPPSQKTRSHMTSGTFVIDADSHFPVSAEFGLFGEDWSEAEVNQLLQSKSKDFRYLVPLGALRFRSSEGAEFRAQGNLSREQFDQSVTRFADRIASAVWSGAKSGPDSQNTGR